VRLLWRGSGVWEGELLRGCAGLSVLFGASVCPHRFASDGVFELAV
jgi:hypothetical protein